MAKDFIKKKIRKGWIVVNCRTGKHTHVRSEYGAACLIFFIRNGIEPTNPYLKVSYERIANTKPEKQRYRNQKPKR